MSICPKKQNREQLAAIFPVCFAALSFLALTLSYWLSHPLTCAPDQALYINMGELLLSGLRPYVDMYDNNPPLIIYLSVIPAVVAQAFAVPPTLGFSLSVCALSLVSMALGALVLVLARKEGEQAFPLHWSSLYLPAALVILALSYFDLNQRIDFGQREHLFVLLYLPFFILRYCRAGALRLPRSAAWLGVLIGLLAGVGLALKHYFVLVALAPEFVWFLMRRNPRVFFSGEVYACLFAIGVYLLHFCFLDREILSGLFDFVVPIYKEGYSYYTNSFVYNFTTVWRLEFLYLFIASFLALLLAPAAADGGALLFGMLAFGLVSQVIYLLAGQSWQYHVLPVRFASCAALFIEAGLIISRLMRRYPRIGFALGALPVLLLLANSAWGRYAEYISEEEQQDKFDLALLGYRGTGYAGEMSVFAEKILSETKRGDSVLFISPAMSPGYPAIVQTGRRPASRFLHGLTFPLLDAVLQTPNLQNKEKLAALQNKMVKEYGEDIRAHKPRLIFIDRVAVDNRLRTFNFQDSYMNDYKMVEEISGILIYKREGG